MCQLLSSSFFPYIQFLDKVYPGQHNSLVMKVKIYAEYGCVYQLQNFPFDTQNCSMDFTMDTAKSEYIKLVPRNISFQVTAFYCYNSKVVVIRYNFSVAI